MMQTDLVICTCRHHSIYHLARVVDAGDGQFTQRACKLNCRQTHINIQPELSSIMCVMQIILCLLPGL